MPNVRTIAAIATLLVVVAACSGSAGAPSTPAADSPDSSPAASPEAEGLTHPMGSDEIVLRMDEGGGFVPIEFNATNVPVFTLYGDGTVIFRDPDVIPQMPGNGQPVLFPALRTATLSEEQIQALLEFAITEGGLAVARERFDNMMISDAPTTTFTINAGGVEKEVSVYALGFEGDPGPDTNVLKSLAKLGERLRNFDQGGTLPSDEYQPSAFRGVLWETGPGMATTDWPWPDLTIEDFTTPAEPDAFGLPTRDLSADEVAALGLGTPTGPVTGLTFDGPDGKAYGFALRPLLPDELD
ncbi:MAG TPA: hypothetical protein VFM44_02055 [Gemmatimonadota bacterium]|nr:hypothetical protein [Gemmatimonadota bacterium]